MITFPSICLGLPFIPAVGQFLEILDIQTFLKNKAMGAAYQHLDIG